MTKKRTKTPRLTELHRVEHLHIDLPPAEPIQIVAALHRSKQDTLFDMHYILELGTVLEGRIQRIYEGHQLTAGPGQVWMCGVWEPHGFKIVEAPCRLLIILVRPDFLVGLNCPEEPGFNWLAGFTAPAAERPQVSGEARLETLALADRIQERSAKNVPRRCLWLRTLVMELLLHLYSGWRVPRVGRPGRLGSFNQLNPALELVFGRNDYITEAAAATACSLGLNLFNRVFKEYMGIGFAQFALRYRLSQVAHRLVSSDEPIKAIAAEWGFADLSHLYRQFKRAYGLTPVHYRNKRRT